MNFYLNNENQNLPLAIALGGGGARGIAHIVVLEALDDMGIVPVAISGSSMGAIIGACYASGMSGTDIRNYFLETTASKSHVLHRLLSARVGKFTDIFSKGLMSNPMLVDGEKFLSIFMPPTIPKTIEELNIPLIVTATNFYARKDVTFTTGALLPAVAASMAIPGLIAPVLYQNMVLIDGGALNPLPVKNVMGRNRLIVAVDVMDSVSIEAKLSLKSPTPLEALYGSVSAMMEALTRAQIEQTPPDLLISPPVSQFHALDFFKTNEILESCLGLKEQVKRRISRLYEQ